MFNPERGRADEKFAQGICGKGAAAGVVNGIRSPGVEDRIPMEIMKWRNALLGGLILVPLLLKAEETAPAVEVAKPVMAAEDTLTEEASADPFASGGGGVPRPPGIPAERANRVRVPLQLRLETWEAPALEVARRLDEMKDPAKLAAMREECLGGAGGVTLVHCPVTALDASTRMLAEQVTEMIYPTEYEPPELPPAGIATKDANAGNDQWTRWLEAAGKHAVPTSFETRNTGETVEAVAQAVAIEEKTWDVALQFEVVQMAGMAPHGAADLLIQMPVFNSFRTGGLLRLVEGEWRLLSALEAPRGIDGKPTGKSWLTLVRVDRTR